MNYRSPRLVRVGGIEGGQSDVVAAVLAIAEAEVEGGGYGALSRRFARVPEQQRGGQGKPSERPGSTGCPARGLCAVG